MIKVKHHGDFSKTYKFLKRAQKFDLKQLEQFGIAGQEALAAATPVDSGETASSWYYQIVQEKEVVRIEWLNSNIIDGVPIAIILQYGHGTGTGGYVQGRDYINPAIQPIFDKIADVAWKELIQ